MFWRGLFALLCALIVSPAAQAEWLEARSRHFILYANTSEATLRRQSEALERLDWSLRRFMAAVEEPDIESRKLTVFLVDDDDIRRLCRCRNVGGFYLSRVSGSVAFSGKAEWTDASNQGRLTLFHEYTHHFLLGTYDLAFPGWYSEGFAEFAATMKIGEDGATIGYPAMHRAYGLLIGAKLSAEQMFDPIGQERWSAEQLDSFYGRGWLMAHYFSFDRDRFAKFRKYLMAMNKGTPSLTAARQEFGDLKELDRDLNAYLKQRKISALTMKYVGAALPNVTIRRLPPGEAAMIGVRMESVRGVGAETGRKLYAKAAPIAARYPDDPIAQGWFAEIAHDGGEEDAAMAAAGKALAHDPKSVQAMLYQARIQMMRLARAKSSDAAAWGKARSSIVAANRADPDDAEPLWWYWQSFQMEGRPPSASSIKGLYKAHELAPQDETVRFAAAVAHIEANEANEAKQLLRPIAYNPHAAADNPAAQMINALDAGKKGAEVIPLAQSAAEATPDENEDGNKPAKGGKKPGN